MTRRRDAARAGRARPAGLLVAALLALATVARRRLRGCEQPPSGALDVVASTSFLADIAQNVAGDRFPVQSLIPRGTDPHSFEPTPSDLRTAAGADLVIVNGGGLEGTLLTTLQNAVGDVPIVDASAGLTTRTPKPGEPALAAGETDPHFWLDPMLVKTYVKNIEAAFSKADPAGAATYKANAAAYDKKLDALDAWIRRQVAQIPPADRKLVMDHASHGYFADRYGFTIIGTVIPSASTSDSPTARQLDRPHQDHPGHGGQGDLRGGRRQPAARPADRRRDGGQGRDRPARPHALRARRPRADLHRHDEVRHAPHRGGARDEPRDRRGRGLPDARERHRRATTGGRRSTASR